MNLAPFIDGLDVLMAGAVTLALAMARLVGVIAVFPVFVRTEIGRLVRGVVAIVFAIPVMGRLWSETAIFDEAHAGILLALVLKEAALGILIGLAMGAPFWAIQAAGELIDQQRELGDSAQHDPAAQGQVSVTASLLMMCAIVIFVTSGGFRILLDLVYQSYSIWPVASFFPTLTADELLPVLRILDQLLLFGVVLAAPVLLLFLLCDITVGFLGRAAPNFGIESFAPLFKNVLYAFVCTVYMYLLLGYSRTHLSEVRSVLSMLEALMR